MNLQPSVHYSRNSPVRLSVKDADDAEETDDTDESSIVHFLGILGLFGFLGFLPICPFHSTPLNTRLSLY